MLVLFLPWSNGSCACEKMAWPWLSYVHTIHLCHPEFLSSCRRVSFVWKFSFLLSHCISELLTEADFRLNATILPKSGFQCSCGSLKFRILCSSSGFYTTAKVDYLFQGRNDGKCMCLNVYIGQFFSCWNLSSVSCSRKDSQTWAVQVYGWACSVRWWDSDVFHCFTGEQNGHSVTQKTNMNIMQSFLSISLKYNLRNRLSRAVSKTVWRSWYESAFG